MKKIISSIVIFIILIINICCFPIICSGAISAKSAVVIEINTGTVLFEKNPDLILPEASTTKIMTALIALENCKYNDYFTVSKAASEVEGSQIGLLEGERISLSDLLYMLMLRSGNDAAHVIAEGIFGDIDKFIEKMNEKARDLGCLSTHFTNPHGLPNDNHYTSACDLAKIAAEAYRNDDFRAIVSTKKIQLDYRDLVIENSNRLLDIYEYATGIKTGFTKAAGRCLVSSAQKDDIDLICVTLNAPNDWDDHIYLLNQCFDTVRKTVIYDAGKYKCTVPSLGGNAIVELINTQPVYGINIKGVDVTFELTENIPVCIFAPIDAGKTVGRLVLSCNGNEFQSVPLSVRRTVSVSSVPLSFLERFSMFFSNFWL